MLVGTHVAASISTRVVESETSDTWPPMIPATPEGPSASHTTAISAVNSRWTPSSVVMVSPAWARRTMIFLPRTSSRSKAWRGWPQVSIT